MNGKLTVFAVFCGGLCFTVGWITNDALSGENVAGVRALAAQRNALACEQRAAGLKQALAESVDVIGGLVGATELPADESLLYCCDWDPGREEDCRMVRKMGSDFCGAVRLGGNKRPSGPAPAPLPIEVD
jgi:hypothetical protein